MSGPGHDPTSEPGTAATPAAKRNLEIASHVRDLYEREGPWGIYERFLALGSMRIVGKESGLSFEGDYAALWEIDGERLRSMRAFLSHEEAEQAAAALEQAEASGDTADA